MTYAGPNRRREQVKPALHDDILGDVYARAGGGGAAPSGGLWSDQRTTARGALPEPSPCPTCTTSPPHPSWRWAGDCWQHKCPNLDANAGHFTMPMASPSRGACCPTCERYGALAREGEFPARVRRREPQMKPVDVDPVEFARWVLNDSRNVDARQDHGREVHAMARVVIAADTLIGSNHPPMGRLGDLSRWNALASALAGDSEDGK